MGLATRLAALEKKARGKGYRVGPPKPEPPLPEGFFRDERGWVWYRMPQAEWAEVEAILDEAHLMAGIERPQAAQLDWSEAEAHERAAQEALWRLREDMELDRKQPKWH